MTEPFEDNFREWVRQQSVLTVVTLLMVLATEFKDRGWPQEAGMVLEVVAKLDGRRTWCEKPS